VHGMERGNQEREREGDVCVHKHRKKKSVRNVLIVIWEVSTASRTYARMGWDDDDDGC
jgi:hypothetical protein